MQNTYVDVISYLQFYFTELPGHCVVIQADFKLSSEFIALTTGLLIFFLLMEYGKLSIAYLL